MGMLGLGACGILVESVRGGRGGGNEGGDNGSGGGGGGVGREMLLMGRGGNESMGRSEMGGKGMGVLQGIEEEEKSWKERMDCRVRNLDVWVNRLLEDDARAERAERAVRGL